MHMTRQRREVNHGWRYTFGGTGRPAKGCRAINKRWGRQGGGGWALHQYKKAVWLQGFLFLWGYCANHLHFKRLLETNPEKEGIM